MPNTAPSTTNKEELRKKSLLPKTSVLLIMAFLSAQQKTIIDEIKRVVGMEGLCGVKIFFGSSTGDLLLENKTVIEQMFKEVPIMFSIHSEDEQIMRANKAKLVNPTVLDHYKWRSKESALSSTKKIIDIANRQKNSCASYFNS